MKKYLLFDLDGTLTDPKIGICTCVQYALAAFGIQEPDLDKLEPFIGPPLKESFMEFYHMSKEQAEGAVEKYRERFQEKGIFENKIYKGVPGMLRALRSKGMVLAVASSKPTVFVRRILEHFHIARYFDVVVGSELDGTRVNKDQVVRETLRQLFQGTRVDPDQVYMIGDRRFDVEGAHAVRVESVGVTYGYGGMEELKEAGSDYIVCSVKELESFLLRGTEDPDRLKGFQKLWQIMFPFLLFYLVRGIATDLLVLGAGYLCGVKGDGLSQGGMNPLKEFLFLWNGDGTLAGLTGNATAIVSALGFMAGGAAVFGMARNAVALWKEETKLEHLREEPPSSYVLAVMAGLGLVLGMNLLLLLSGVIGQSEAYQAVAESQYAPWLPIGLVCYGLVSPIAEELLFRGILFVRLRRFVEPVGALLFSAALFAFYHGNIVQGIYGFVIGCFLGYIYEYFGDFRMAVAVHMIANLVVYGLSRGGAGATFFASWPVCIGWLVLGAVCAGVLHRRKAILF